MKRSSINMELRSSKRKSFHHSNSDMQPDAVECGINISDDQLAEINILDDQLAEIISKFIPMCQWSSCLEYVSKKFQRCVLLAYRRVKVINLRKLYSLKRPKYDNNWPSWKLSEENAATARLNNILKKLLSVCPNLTGIAGFDCVVLKMHSKTAWNILKKFAHLQSIFLECVRIEIIEFEHFANFVAGSKSLKNLTISHCLIISYGDTFDIGSLSSVDFSCRLNLQVPILGNLSEKLTTLKIHSFRRSFKSASDAEQAMKMCVNLDTLSVGIDGVDDYKTFLKILPNLCKLTELHVIGGIFRDILFVDAYFCVQLDLIKNRLQLIEFNCVKLSDEVQEFLFTKCLQLQCLKINRVFSQSTDALKNVRNLPGNLKELAFQDFGGQTLPLLLPTLMPLSNFTALTIEGNSLSGEWENICLLVNLKHLRVYGGFINDSLLEKWDKKNDKIFKNFVTLEMPRCKGVSDASGCFLAKKSINLQILDLSLSKISDKTISIVADVAKKLKTANFTSCDLLLDEEIILGFIKKAVCLKKLKIDKSFAEKLLHHKDFLPFVEYVDLEDPRANLKML